MKYPKKSEMNITTFKCLLFCIECTSILDFGVLKKF